MIITIDFLDHYVYLCQMIQLDRSNFNEEVADEFNSSNLRH